MKKGCSPRRKYANGTGKTGVGPSNYIQNPAETLADYNIMLAKAEQEALSNPWLPIVGALGAVGQSVVGSLRGPATSPMAHGVDKPVEGAANGNNNVQGDIEAEGGEMIETPAGQVQELKGPSHEQGGIPLQVNQDVPEGTKIYSDRLKVGDKTLAERKAARERQMANIEKSVSNGADLAIKNAAQRKIKAIEAEEASDLQFQENVNNMLEMTKSAMKAFGTGMQGVQKYAGGTGPGGIQYDENGVPITGFAEGLGVDSEGYSSDLYSRPIPFKKDVTGSADYETNIIKNIQEAIGVTSDGIWGPKSNLAMRNWQKTNSPENYKFNVKNFGKDFSFSSKDINRFYDPKNGKGLKKMAGLTPEGYKYTGPDIPEVPEYTPPGETTPTGVLAGMEKAYQDSLAKEDLPGTVVSRALGKTSKLAQKYAQGLPGAGDITKLVGNVMASTAGLKTAAEQRSTDVTNKNVYADIGKQSLKDIEDAKSTIESQKAAAIIKATAASRGGKKGARGSARGINQSRAMDWLYDTALNQTMAEISANATQQSVGLSTKSADINLQSDMYRGKGAADAALANEAQKDAYYNAVAQGRVDMAKGVQQTGKDINAMKQNDVITNLMQQFGKYVTVDAKGNIIAKPTKKK
jgi:hypothetical protein